MKVSTNASFKNLEKSMTFDGKTIKLSNTVEILSITLERNINLELHIGENIFCSANQKTKVYFRIRKFLNYEQAQILAEAYILSNFRY